MTACKYYDCGWCYAPDDVETSASSQSACFDYDFCPYLKSQMTKEIDISKVLIEGDTATIMGVKYKRVESETKTLRDVVYDWWDDVFTEQTSINDLIDRIEVWLPKEQSAQGSQNVYVECSVEGFNDCLNKIKQNLR